MRTVDPEKWSKARTNRALFGSESLSAFETRLRSSFMAAMREFWAHSSIRGVRYMRENRSKPYWHCYLLCNVLLLCWGAFALSSTWHEYRGKPPFSINLYSLQHPAQHVPFPAVALCSYGILSRTAIDEYAGYLWSLDKNNTFTREAIVQNLLAFGALQGMAHADFDVHFMRYLAEVAGETNATNVIIRLAPKCSSFLTRCAWHSARAPCDRLFGLRVTPYGLCCVFNSRYQPEDLRNQPQKVNFIGQEAGLSVIANENYSDVAYVRTAVEGLKVLFFDGNEYPLIEGGSTRMHLTQRDTITYFKLTVKAQYTISGLEQYAENWRGCRIRADHSPREERRSQAWCLLGCRRRAARALCGCVPTSLLPDPTDAVCSLDHLTCLNKHREKFSYLYPGDGAPASLSEEAADSLDCARCRPDCSRLLYSAATSHANYQFSDKLFLTKRAKGHVLINTTILRIFYASEDQHLFIVETNLRWFEVAVSLSSQCFGIIAVTVISLAELLYFLTVRWGRHYMRAPCD